MSSESAYIRGDRAQPGGESWDAEILKNLGYKKGMILRVKMVNFLTYDECEVFPGPKLNVILGPNGTGKSTIMHAVCLACAGSPATVGRSPKLSQFIKKGKEQASEGTYVEIDLMSKGVGGEGIGKTVRVRRVLQEDKQTR